LRDLMDYDEDLDPAAEQEEEVAKWAELEKARS
jgi:hypothetical protein